MIHSTSARSLLAGLGGLLIGPLLTNAAQAQTQQAQIQTVAPSASNARRPNVLMVNFDDLKPTLGAYGDPLAITPHLDAFAQSGTLFTRAYCQQAICSPSRISLLLGQRPDTTRVFDLFTPFQRHQPDAASLLAHFRAHGYETIGQGKTFHARPVDDPRAWDSAPPLIPWLVYGTAGTARRERDAQERLARGEDVLNRPNLARGPAWEAADRDDDELPDGELTTRTIDILRSRQPDDKPFFLSLGYAKPHLPFIAPQKYFDLYPRERFELPQTWTSDPASSVKNAVPAAFHNSGELRFYADVPQSGPVSDEEAINLIRAYYASTSYVDALFGRVMQTLRETGLDRDTIVLVWSDHGYHLGDHGLWNKHSNFEQANLVPLMMRVPGQRTPGGVSNAFVELIDLYPTLCQAAGLPLPSTQTLEGQSFLHLLDDPRAGHRAAAISQYPRGPHMGYSLREDRFRYTDWGALGAELYDYESDPLETINLIDDPAHSATVERLRAQLFGIMPGARAQFLRTRGAPAATPEAAPAP